jgi:LuxR family maltose regulon positive regulatory protein
MMLSLTIALWDVGRTGEVVSAAEEAARLAQQAGNWHAYAIMRCFFGLAQAALGRLNFAKEIYEQITRKMPGIPAWVGGGFAHVCLSALFYEWDDLEQASEYAYMGLEYSKITGHSEIEMNCYRQLAFIYQAQGDSERVREILDQAEAVIQKHYLSRLWGPEHVQLALAQNDLIQAQYWMEKVIGEYGAAIHYPAIPLEPAKLALAKGDKADAADYLANSYRKASQDGIHYAQIEIRILQALTSLDEEQGIAFLSEALAWGEPEGFVRVFVDYGEAFMPLLHRAARMGIQTDYVFRLLSAMEKAAETNTPVIQPLIKPLSVRELEVLRLVADGKSNQEISAELVIALGTVKRHIFNIFNKLDAKNRTECAARARALGLIE